MVNLAGKVALVTGASRGVGKGIAVGLGEAGATVYVTGRTRVAGASPGKMGGTIYAAAEAVTQAGGVGLAAPCDHTDDAQTRSLFARIQQEQGRLDILVNNVWGGYEHFYDGVTEFWREQGFWDTPFDRWDKMFTSGVRAHFTASALAAPIMIAQRSGLIVNVSYFAAQRDDKGVAYGAAKAADDHMVRCMAHELRPHQVAVVTLYPGLVRTESVLAAAEFFDMHNSESPEFQGRAVAALAADPAILAKSGQVQVSAQVALDYGFTDVDGRQPRPLSVAEA
ncbi:MAG TPA: short-chain dehydrogenase [Chloroflexi bacterium]|nr:short-chain dehydrogenase [Chloroflexota bacterium]HHW89144.1 SDR family NAD(P)-dependent oxidoreductase [Chloroflexota bacterium]